MSGFGGSGGSGAAGGVGGSGGAPLQPIPESEFYARLGEAFCQGLDGCCIQAGLSPKEQCAAVEAYNFEQLLRPESNVEFDPVQAAECVAAVSAGAVTCDVSETWPQLLGECRYVYVGQLAVGESCEFGYECAPPPPNDDGDAYCGGDTCVHVYRGKLGEPCTGTCYSNNEDGCYLDIPPASTAVCWMEDGLHCSPVSFSCQPMRQAGESCIPDAPSSFRLQCIEGLSCLGSSVCGTPPGPGQPCDLQGSIPCADSSFCDNSAGVCAAKLPDAAACANNYQCQGERCLNGACTSNTLAGESNCG
jgi:hypothetical protein